MTGMNGQTTGQEDIGGLPLIEAARRMGITNDALRKRISRDKTIHAYKQGRQWFVILPVERPDQADSRPEPTESDRTTTGTTDSGEVAALKAHITTLETQLTARTREVEELHILLQREQSRSLPAPQETRTVDNDQSTTEQSQDDTKRRAWWKLWGS